MATHRTPISAKSILYQAPLSWTLLAEYDSSIVVSVTTRHERENSVVAGSYLLTSEVEILRDSWQVWSTSEPLLSELESTEHETRMCAAIALELLADDVARALESGNGVRFRDVFACAEAA